MKPTLLIVADAARCRLISVKSGEREDFEPSIELVEQDALANPEALLPGQSIYSDVKSGRNRSHAGGPAHGYDDHRDRHHDEMLRKFTRDIVARAERVMKAQALAQVVLIANSRLLGFLRGQVPPRLHERVTTTIEEDATKKNLDQLRGLLVEHEIVAPLRPNGGYRSRGFST